MGSQQENSSEDQGEPSEIERFHRRRGAILTAVARATERVLSAGSWRQSAPELLSILGQATNVSRVYLFERTSKNAEITRVSQRFEWAAAEAAPQINNPDLQELELEPNGYERWVSLLKQGLPVVGDIHDFPLSERPLLESQAIQSILVQPVFVGASWWGFMGFDACERLQSWQTDEIDALKIAALVFGSSLHLEQREALFRQAHKMEALGRMAGGVAHDFNNLLAVIFGSLDLLSRALQHGTDPEPHLEVIQQASTNAAHLTRQLLEFSRRREKPTHQSDPRQILDRMSELLRHAAGNKVQIDTSTQGTLAPVSLDPGQIEQILMNLVVNARDAMPVGGVLQIRLSTITSEDARSYGDQLPLGLWTMLSVRDSGLGIPEELRERIFEPFFTTKEVGQGTGLGLATVYGIVSSAGGFIRLTSLQKQGTDFRIYLPVASHLASSPRPLASLPQDLGGHGESILVCDDNTAFREWIVHVLCEAGYQAFAMPRPEACLALPEAQQKSVALLVTDVRMPGMDGPTLRRKLRTIHAELPTIFLSGFTAGLLEREGLDPTSEAFLEKPFTREQLLIAVHQALHLSGPSSAPVTPAQPALRE